MVKAFCALIVCLICVAAYVFRKRVMRWQKHRKWMALVERVKDLHIHIITTYIPRPEEVEMFAEEIVTLRRKAKEHKNFAREILLTRLEMAEKMLQAKVMP